MIKPLIERILKQAMANFERASCSLTDWWMPQFFSCFLTMCIILSIQHSMKRTLISVGIGDTSNSPEREVELFNVHLKQSLSDLFKPSIIKAFNAFNLKELKAGTVLPKSKWGYIIKSDGAPVIRL
jgi:hypothetical protein